MAKRITIEALFEGKGVGAAVWSPDSQWVAFSVGETDYERNGGRTRLWLMSADGKVLFPLTSGLKSDGSFAADSRPGWSPDGELVAFYSNRGGSTQIWLIRPFGGEAMPLTGAETGCGALMTDGFFSGMDWSPDGRQIAFVAEMPEPDEEPESDVKVVGAEYGEGYASVKSRMHIWAVSVDGGKAKRLTRGDHHHGDPRWSPDGKSIAFVCNRSRDEEAVSASINKNYDLWLIPSTGGKVRKLTTNRGPDISPRWAPDGRAIAYLSCSRCGSHSDVFDLCVLDVAGGKSRCLSPDFVYSPDRLSSQCWTPDSRSIIFSAGVKTANRVFQASASGPGITELTRGRRFVSAPALAPNGRTLAQLVQDAKSLGELQLLSLKPRRVRVTTQFNDWLKSCEIGDSEIVRWRSDEFTIEGVVIKPPGYREGRRYPTVVIPHGGPHGRVTTILNTAWQLLAAQGYVILAPNFRGSTCYGQAFIDADRNDFGGGDFRDIMRGLDKLIEDGIADPDRLGIWGASYGGFMTTWSVGNTDRYQAAVAVCGVTNLHSMFGTTDIKSWTTWEFGGYPWEEFDDLVRCSPVTYAANVKTPTLILHGEKDLRVPVSQSEEFYTALKARGVKTQFVRYPDEGHGIGQPRHVADYWQRSIDWLKKYLGRGQKRRR